jgi:hypothetical protein
MNVTKKTECRTIGWSFLAIATVIEFMLLCALFNTFAEGWLKVVMVGVTLTIFNIATWFFAMEYRQTLNNIRRK